MSFEMRALRFVTWWFPVVGATHYTLDIREPRRTVAGRQDGLGHG